FAPCRVARFSTCFCAGGAVYDIRRALAYGNGPLLIIVPLYDENNPQGQIWRKPQWHNPGQEESKLGHCMTLIAYDDDKQAFLIRNSWGKSWGPMRNGHTWMPYSDIDQNMFWESYVLFIDGKLHL